MQGGGERDKHCETEREIEKERKTGECLHEPGARLEGHDQKVSVARRGATVSSAFIRVRRVRV